MNKLNLVKELSKKYEMKEIETKVDDVLNSPSVSIGVLGEFSSGKTSLVNSMLDLTLPTNINPTTKSICLIKSENDIEENQYFVQENNVDKQIERFDFEDILNGNKEGVALIKVKPSEVLPLGCIFVDTPGISSIDETESLEAKETKLTYGYLSLVDAAIVCIDIKEGTINKKVQDFICRQELRPIHNNMIFALTFSDTKTEQAQETIKNNIISQLEKLVQDGLFLGKNIENKVFTISNLDEDNAEKVYGYLKESVLNDLPKIRENKKEREIERIAIDLKNMLENKKDSIEAYNSDDIDDKIAETKQEIRKIEENIDSRKNKILDAKKSIEERIVSILECYREDVIKEQPTEQRLETINTMNNDLVSLLTTEMKKYSENFVIPEALVKLLNRDLISRLNNIEKYKEKTVTLSTAMLAAGLGGATSVVGNAIEMGVGAVIQKKATNVVKNSVRNQLLENAYNRVEKQLEYSIPESAPIKKEGGLINGILTTIKTINPLEHIGTFVADEIKKKGFDEAVRCRASMVADSICSQLDLVYQKEIIEPLMLSLSEKEKDLEKLKNTSDKDWEKYKEYKVNLEKDIESLM